ncbi:MAG: YdeI/OmpD-associated family protein [Coriobacteriia bacterium]
MAANLSELPLIRPRDAAEWRVWLAANHATAPGAWVAIAKKSAPEPRLGYEDAVRVALTFGWIDSTVHKLDEHHTRQLWTPRKRGSGWAESNKRRVEELIAQGAMKPAGLAVIEAAKADGSWNLYDDVETLVIPDDLQAAFDADREAATGFAALSESVRKQLLYGLAMAKRDTTRAKRIAEIVRAARAKTKRGAPRAPRDNSRGTRARSDS